MNKLIVALPKSIRQQQQIHAAFESILSSHVVTYSCPCQLQLQLIKAGNWKWEPLPVNFRRYFAYFP